MNNSLRLQLRFIDENNKEFSISLADFKEGLTLTELEEACGKIISSQAFARNDVPVKELKKAAIIQTQISELK